MAETIFLVIIVSIVCRIAQTPPRVADRCTNMGKPATHRIA
jgi:hypothetical protein